MRTPTQKCRAVCAAIGRPAAIVDRLNEEERNRLAELYDTCLGPAEELPGKVAAIVGEARLRLEQEAKATDEELEETGGPALDVSPGIEPEAVSGQPSAVSGQQAQPPSGREAGSEASGEPSSDEASEVAMSSQKPSPVATSSQQTQPGSLDDE